MVGQVLPRVAAVDAQASEGVARAAAKSAKAAEDAKWLTLAQLQSGDYEGCSRLPVDEKNKEEWLRDEEFVQVFGKTREEWAKVPPFKKPMIKKKLGLQAL